MLQIYIFGPNEEGFLDLNPGTSLDVESLADMFDEDFTAGEYSLPAEFPWTDNNKRLLGFSERLENNSQRQYYWRCHVYESGWPEMMNAKLTLLDKAGSFSYRRGKFNGSISGNKGLFGSLARGKKLKDLPFARSITWSNMDSRQFAQHVMSGERPDLWYLAFAPVAIEDFFDKNRKDYQNEFLVLDTVNCIVDSGAGWVFGRPKSNAPNLPAEPGTMEYMDYRTVPFFNWKYILQKCFEMVGFTVSGGPMSDQGFNDLFIFNNVAIERYNRGQQKDYNNFLIPANHMPDILVTDFLKACCSFFCCYPAFDGNNSVRLVYRKTAFTNRNPLSLDGIAAADFESTLPALNNSGSGSGFRLNYTWDPADGYYSDHVKDLSDKNLVATVATRLDLFWLNVGRQLTTDDIAYVESENMYYVIADASSMPLVWEVYSENLGEYVSGDGDNGIEIPVSTLCTAVMNNPASGLNENKGYLAHRGLGSYTAASGVRVRNPFGLRLFYLAKSTFDNRPFTTNHNRDTSNTRVRPYSLAWNGPDGMAENLHKKWQLFKANAEIVKTKVIANQKTLYALASNSCYELDGVIFLPYQVNRTIPSRAEVEIKMMPL